ncbi:hypothetical protein SNARM312S_07342 [Streptomyces narbonensis]
MYGGLRSTPPFGSFGSGWSAGVTYSALKSGIALGDGVRPGAHASARRPSGSKVAWLTWPLASVVVSATPRPGSTSCTWVWPSGFVWVTLKT